MASDLEGRHLRKDIVFSCNLRCRLIFLHGRSRTYRVASLHAGPVGLISYNLYFDGKHVRYVTCDLINEYSSSLLYSRNTFKKKSCSLIFHCNLVQACNQSASPLIRMSTVNQQEPF